MNDIDALGPLELGPNGQLAVWQRLELVRRCELFGEAEAARISGVDYKVARHWYRQYLAGLPLVHLGGNVSFSDYHRIFAAFSDLGKKSFSAIARKHKLAITGDSFARVVRKMDVPEGKMTIIVYAHADGSHQHKALEVFFGKCFRTRCTICGKPLKIKKKHEVYFAHPSLFDFYLSQGKLVSIGCADFKKRILPLLAIPKNKLLLLIRSNNQKFPHKLHLVKRQVENEMISFCNRRYTPPLDCKVWNNLMTAISPTSVCERCADRFTKWYKPGKNLTPELVKRKISDREKWYKIFQTAARVGCVKTACKLHGVTRSGYYSARTRLNKITK